MYYSLQPLLLSTFCFWIADKWMHPIRLAGNLTQETLKEHLVAAGN
jgi:hypothetical protein